MNIVDHDAFGRVSFPGGFHGKLKGLGHRLAVRVNNVYIYNGVEQVAQTEGGEHSVGVSRICVGGSSTL